MKRSVSFLIYLFVFLLGNGLLLSDPLEAEESNQLKHQPRPFVFFPNQPGKPSLPPPSGGQIVRIIQGERAPGTDTPEWLAGTTSLIVDARVSKKENPQSVRNHLTKIQIESGVFAWQDFTFDQVKVIWKDKDVPDPGKALNVRVYDAETPDVIFKVSSEPEFEVGERYLLFLWEVDGLANDVGTEHWRVVGGSSGAFVIDKDQTKRKGEYKNESPKPLDEILKGAIKGFTNEEKLSRSRRYRSQAPKGIKWENSKNALVKKTGQA
jgi:hypothetical protein